MANTENKVSQEVIHCDYCMDDGQTVTAAAFCVKCGKYLCVPCIKSHGKFMPDHSLKRGSEMPNKEDAKAYMPCKIHTDQVVELFCKNHKSVFCKFCKLLKHKKCDTKTIQLAMKDINIKDEFEATFANLLHLQENIEKKQDESQRKLNTYSKDKREMIGKVNSIQSELNEIFDEFKRRLDDKEQTDIETLNAQVESYSSLLRPLESHLKFKKATRGETKDERLFLHLTEMNQICEEYKELTDHLEHESTYISSFVLQDDRLTPVVQKLNSISSVKELWIEENQANRSWKYNNFQTPSVMKTDRSCQTDDMQEGKSEEIDNPSENQKKNLFVLNDDPEKGSSEEDSEKQMERCFSKVKSFHYRISRRFGYREQIMDCCMMPDGKAIVCKVNCLMILDADLENKCEIRLWDSEHYPKFIAVMDRNSFVVSLAAAKVLQIFSVTPEIGVEIRGEIRLKWECSGLKFQNNFFYIYVRDIGSEFSCLRQEGIQILSLNGELIKSITLPLADDILCFCVNKAGIIIYFCKRPEKSCLKCITVDGTELFCQSRQELPVTVIPDDEGNMTICDQRGRISVIKSDGSQGPGLGTMALTPYLLCYNKCNNTFLVVNGKFENFEDFEDSCWIYDLSLVQIDFF